MLSIRGKSFHAGIVHHVSFAHTSIAPLDSTLELLRDPFYGVVEGAWKLNEEGRARLRQAFDFAQVECVYCVGGFMRESGINLNALSEADRGLAVETVKGYIDTAYSLGAVAIVFCSGADPGPEKRDLAKESFRKSVAELCRYSYQIRPEKPVWLNLENFDRDLDQRRLLGPTSETVEFLASLPSDCKNVGLTLDLSHLKQLGEDVRQAVRIAGQWLVHGHIANCVIKSGHPLRGDKHVRFGFPDSAVQLHDVVDFLHEMYLTGYFDRKDLPTRLPTISFEIKAAENEDPWLLVANGQRTLSDAVRIVNKDQ